MADRSNIELLVEYVRVQNDDWRREVYREGAERAKQLGDMITMLERALSSARDELRSLGQYVPVVQQRAEPIPRVVKQGPLPEHLRPEAKAKAAE